MELRHGNVGNTFSRIGMAKVAGLEKFIRHVIPLARRFAKVLARVELELHHRFNLATRISFRSAEERQNGCVGERSFREYSRSRGRYSVSYFEASPVRAVINSAMAGNSTCPEHPSHRVASSPIHPFRRSRVLALSFFSSSSLLALPFARSPPPPWCLFLPPQGHS